MKLRFKLLSILALAVGFALPAQAGNPAGFPVQYMVKFVCGFVPANTEPPRTPSEVKPGNYATAINIHNYTINQLAVGKRVALHYRSGGALPPAPAPSNVTAFRFRVLEIDCIDIWNMVGVPPETFVKGMVHIGTPIPLPVAAVYTSQTNLNPTVPPDAGAGISIDVEQFTPFINAAAP